MTKEQAEKAKRAHLEQLLQDAKELQTQLWDKLSEIEVITGTDIESDDLNGLEIDDLLDDEEESEAEESE